MKSTIACLISSLFFLNFASFAQQPLPADAEAFYKKAMTSINQKHINWVKQTAAKNKLTETDARKLTQAYAVQNNLKDMDIDALVALVMMQAGKDQEKDLRDMLAEQKKRNEEKQKLREAQAAMEKNKNSMNRHMLDSFKLITNAKQNIKPSTSTTRVQTVQTTTRVNTQPVSQVSLAEIKEVQDSLKSKMDSLSEMSEMTSLRLQMQTDRRSKFITTLSNMMKKMADTQGTIIQNLK